MRNYGIAGRGGGGEGGGDHVFTYVCGGEGKFSACGRIAQRIERYIGVAVGPFCVESEFVSVGEGSVDQFFGIALVFSLFGMLLFRGLRNELFVLNNFLFLEKRERGEGLVERAVVGGLVAEIEREANHIIVDEGFILKADGAFYKPMVLCHIGDQEFFRSVLGRVRFLERFEKGFEFDGIFSGKKDGAGSQAVF